MSSTLQDIASELDHIRAQSLWKIERPILRHQSSHIGVTGGREVLNFCANNYLGLADNPELIAAAKAALDSHGLGMASVRFICGTSDLHRASSGASPITSAWTTPSCLPPASMPMARCSSRCSASRMRSSRMR